MDQRGVNEIVEMTSVAVLVQWSVLTYFTYTHLLACNDTAYFSIWQDGGVHSTDCPLVSFGILC